MRQSVKTEGKQKEYMYGGNTLVCLASEADGWDHISVHVKSQDRCPTWDEMCAVKALFFNDNETVVQFHPADDQYVNNHEYTLHLWKHREQVVPPRDLVGEGMFGING